MRQGVGLILLPCGRRLPMACYDSGNARGAPSELYYGESPQVYG
jgi:hypothetical protein